MAEPAKSQTDVVIHGIKTMITEGRLSPGARLPVEKDLAAILGVSRGPLREGVRALAILGVLETRQGDGTYVTSLDASLLLNPLNLFAELQSPREAAQLLGVRRVLEAESAALAANGISEEQLATLDGILDRLDDIVVADPDVDLDAFIDADTEFHRTIADASGNPALAVLIQSLIGRTFRARVWRAISEHGAVLGAQAEHRGIVAELRRRDPERARIRMAMHVLGVEKYAAEHLDDAPH